jgi:hypothetical protein
MKYVSFSLYGKESMYYLGLMRNIASVSRLLPDYQVIAYISKDVPFNFRKKLLDAGAMIVKEEPAWPDNGMFWRFFAIHLPDAERVLIRDCDSDITAREVAAVREWEVSGLPFHIMRDHPFHTAPILGGMWGAVPSEVSKYFDKNTYFNFSNHKKQDQEYLASIYPSVRSQSLVHDSFFKVERNAKKFPLSRLHGEYIGEPLDSNGAPINPLSRNFAAKIENNWVIKLLLEVQFRFIIFKTMLPIYRIK